MNYPETVAFLFNKLPMFSRIGSDAFKKGLANTLCLCEAIGNPHTKLKSVHIAGTNGKGSTSHILAAIFQTAGYKTGLYTSPHLKDFRERIRVNGQLCDANFVTDFTKRIMPLIDKLSPSFFEITVAMAFDYFAQQEVDIAIIEVGMGGRLDSTNIIMPQLSIITNIGLDHTNMLGNTLPEIASEKAGIIKKGIPVIIGETISETNPVFVQKAAETGSPLIFAEEKRIITESHYQQQQLVAGVADIRHNTHTRYRLDLPGIYQLKNLLTVLAAIDELQAQGWQIAEHHIHTALQQVKPLTGLHGRWEMIHTHPTIVLDVAHNVNGIQEIIRQLALSDYKQLHIVIGMVKDKEIDAVLALLPKQAQYYFTQAQIPRALDAESLLLKASRFELKGAAFPEVNDALQQAKAYADADDLILVCGSVFLVGEVV